MNLPILFDYKLLNEGLRHYVPISLESSLLCVGRTGSGKSYFLNLLTGKMSKYIPNVSITICDYKKSSFAQFEDTPNFFGYEDVPFGIQMVYKEFCERLKVNDVKRNAQIKILLIDEYGAMISSQEKRQADELKMMVGNMLFMGRSLGIRTVVGVQSAYSDLFKAGARDQFGAILALGNLSKEQKQMLFSNYKEDMTENNGIGQGFLYVDGQGGGIQRVVVPRIRNFRKLDIYIRQGLLR